MTFRLRKLIQCLPSTRAFGIETIEGAMAQWWSRGLLLNQVQNQVDALVPFGKALIFITKSLGEDLKLSVIRLIYVHIKI